ncbi:MAG: Na+/H+ antiporter NhaC [Pseudomonadota bacterium]
MTSTRSPSLLDALLPIGALIILLGMSVYVFQDNSSYGPNQIALTLCAGIAALVCIKNGHQWNDVLDAIIKGISTAMGAILILLSVGGLIGTWLMSGTVPSLIYYGLEFLNPQVFYAASCVICLVAALATGSSWTVAGTLGVALIGVSKGLGLSDPITAGAIVSGAYFGDKMSPLSDSTNLAPAVVGTDLFRHIRHMIWTTGPSITIAIILFAIIGLRIEVDSAAQADALRTMSNALDTQFNISEWTLIPMLVVFVMAYRKVPPLPTILFGALLGGFMAMILQPEVVLALADAPDMNRALAMTKGVWMALADGYAASTGVAEVDDLLSRGGMSSMLVTIWLILTALAFGAVLEHGGMLKRLIQSAIQRAKSTGSLVFTVVLSAIGINVVAADQYIAIVLPGRMFKAEFKRRGLAAHNLSRIVEDAGTLTSPLIPWNTCGAFMASTLAVSTLAYLPFAFFNLINPLISVLYGFTGFTMERLDDTPAQEQAA